MMCPHCGNDLIIPTGAIASMESYHSPCVVKTECCGNGVVALPKFSFKVRAYSGDRTEDDWGRTFNG